MGFRYHRSVTICKGVRVNFSKSGPSLSIGGWGHTVNISGRGARETFSIPGTGLSYSRQIGGTGRSSRSAPRRTVQLPNKIVLHMDDATGAVQIADGKGHVITDPAVLRKIRSTDAYKVQKAKLQEQRLQKAEAAVADSEAEIRKFLEIYKLSANVKSRMAFEKALQNLKPAADAKAEYQVPMPSQEEIRSALEAEAKANVKASVFKTGKLRKAYVDEHFGPRYAQAVEKWRTEKDAFDAKETKRHLVAVLKNQKVCEERRAFFKKLITGDDEAVCAAFDHWIAFCALPVEIHIQYDWQRDTGLMCLDVDLPEIEDLPATKMTATSTGKLKEKKRTQTELRETYATLVFGLAVFIASHTFNLSPAIEKILISGYTQRRNRAGEVQNDYIYSLKFPRDSFEKTPVAHTSPQKFCLDAESRCKMTTTSLFRAIEPYEIY
ncbi:MAG: DUF4236 domain-containing protein [Pseudoramibacter sp.]